MIQAHLPSESVPKRTFEITTMKMHEAPVSLFWERWLLLRSMGSHRHSQDSPSATALGSEERGMMVIFNIINYSSSAFINTPQSSTPVRSSCWELRRHQRLHGSQRECIAPS